MMSRIFAVLAGINNYSEVPLDGCINDICEVETWLQSNFSSDVLQLKRLTDKDELTPTRANIIEAFSLFDQATDNDTCLFYFAGHGTNVGAPKEFVSDAGSGCVQALMCIDWQRNVPHQGYIIDKELSYLIWKATKNKNVHFIAITDCCHSGSNTRSVEVDDSKTRQLELLEQSKNITEYLGYGETIDGQGCYLLNEEGSIAVARGPHIHIAAARDSEIAKELTLKQNGEAVPRGAMSLALCQILTATGGKISYNNLKQDIANRIKRFYYGAVSTYQKPVLNLYNLDAEHLNYIFLTTERFNQADTFRVYADKQYGWCISGGLLNGLSDNDNGVLQVGDREIHFSVSQASLLQAKVTMDEAAAAELSVKKNYLANVAFMKLLPVNDVAGRYNYLVGLQNAKSHINTYEVILETATSVVNGKYQLAPSTGKEVHLQYFVEGGKSYPPVFQLSIKNTGTETLYCSFAYLQFNGEISTAGQNGFDGFQVEPGNIQALLSPSFSVKKIKLANDTAGDIVEYLKIFISKDIPIPLECLQAAGNEITRDIERNNAPMDDWAVETVTFTVAPVSAL